VVPDTHSPLRNTREAKRIERLAAMIVPISVPLSPVAISDDDDVALVLDERAKLLRDVLEDLASSDHEFGQIEDVGALVPDGGAELNVKVGDRWITWEGEGAEEEVEPVQSALEVAGACAGGVNDDLAVLVVDPRGLFTDGSGDQQEWWLFVMVVLVVKVAGGVVCKMVAHGSGMDVENLFADAVKPVKRVFVDDEAQLGGQGEEFEVFGLAAANVLVVCSALNVLASAKCT